MGNCGTGEDGKKPPGGAPTTVGEQTGQVAMTDRPPDRPDYGGQPMSRSSTGVMLTPYQNPSQPVPPSASAPNYPTPSQYPPQQYAQQYQQPMVQNRTTGPPVQGVPAHSYLPGSQLQSYQARAPNPQRAADDAAARTFEKRVKNLRGVFPGVDPEMVRDVVLQTPDEKQQIEILQALHESAKSQGRVPQNSYGVQQRGPPVAAFSVNEHVEAAYQGMFHPCIISEVHLNHADDGELPSNKYTVQWVEDGTITLVREDEIRRGR